MSVVDLFILIRRNVKLFLAAMVFGVVVSLVYVFVQPPLYTATATVVISDYPSEAAAFVKGYTPPEGITVSYSTNLKTKSLILVATGADADACVLAANNTGGTVVKDAGEMYPDRFYRCYKATEAVQASRNIPKYAVAGIIAGFAFAFIVVVVLYLKKRPILSVSSLQRALGATLFCDLTKTPPTHRPKEVYGALLKTCVDGSTLIVCALDKTARTVSVLSSLQKAASKRDKKELIYLNKEDCFAQIVQRNGLEEDVRVVLLIDSASSSMDSVDNAKSYISMQRARLDSFIFVEKLLTLFC